MRIFFYFPKLIVLIFTLIFFASCEYKVKRIPNFWEYVSSISAVEPDFSKLLEERGTLTLDPAIFGEHREFLCVLNFPLDSKKPSSRVLPELFFDIVPFPLDCNSEDHNFCKEGIHDYYKFKHWRLLSEGPPNDFLLFNSQVGYQFGGILKSFDMKGSVNYFIGEVLVDGEREGCLDIREDNSEVYFERRGSRLLLSARAKVVD